MAKCTGLDLVLVMRLEVEWLAWPPFSSSLLLSPCLSFLSSCLASSLEVISVFGCVRCELAESFERKMRELLALYSCFLENIFLSLLFLVLAER